MKVVIVTLQWCKYKVFLFVSCKILLVVFYVFFSMRGEFYFCMFSFASLDQEDVSLLRCLREAGLNHALKIKLKCSSYSHYLLHALEGDSLIYHSF